MLQFWRFWTQSDTLLIQLAKNTVCRLFTSCDDEENRKMAVKINVGIRRLDMATGLAFEPRGPNRNADHVQINSFLRQVSLQCLWIQKIKAVNTTSKIIYSRFVCKWTNSRNFLDSDRGDGCKSFKPHPGGLFQESNRDAAAVLRVRKV